MWASTCLLPELKIALSNAQMILDLSDKHRTHCMVELLGCERNGRWKPLLSCTHPLFIYLFIYFCTHPLNMTGSSKSQFTDLKVFICWPAKEILDLQLSLGNLCTCSFLDLVFLLTLVISPTGMPSPRNVWISPLEALADHPSSKGIVCFSSEFLSHLSDTFLFGTIHGLSCFVGCLSSCMHFKS